jgi:hypothetical protein
MKGKKVRDESATLSLTLPLPDGNVNEAKKLGVSGKRRKPAGWIKRAFATVEPSWGDDYRDELCLQPSGKSEDRCFPCVSRGPARESGQTLEESFLG